MRVPPYPFLCKFAGDKLLFDSGHALLKQLVMFGSVKICGWCFVLLLFVACGGEEVFDDVSLDGLSSTDTSIDQWGDSPPVLQAKSPDFGTMGACLPIEVTRKIPQGRLVQDEPAIPLDVNMDSGGLFADPYCTTPLESVAVPAGTVGRTFYVEVASKGELILQILAPGGTELRVEVEVAQNTYTEDERPSRALVVYNVLADGSEEIAEHYASERGIASERLCPVRLPRGLYATAAELLGARKTIVEECICPLLDDDLRPNPCSTESLDKIMEQVPIAYLALIRGIPARLSQTGWPSDYWEPSFDFYLSLLLARDLKIFEQSNGGVQSVDYPIMNSVRGFLPPLDPSAHGFVANGRIEAINTERTLELIDRTLAAETDGFQGRILTERTLDPEHLDETPGRYFTSSFGPECTDYLSFEPFVFEAPESSWNPTECRWGSTGSTAQGSHQGMMPGSNKTTVAYARDVSLFLGTEPRASESPTNGQVGFNNHQTMLRWRKGMEDCLPLCSDFESELEVANCIDDSNDFFKQINTSCVGVNSGFLGQQVRSYPVQYYGFFPPGWSVPGGGGSEKTPPRLLTSGGHDGGGYLHFGQASHEEPSSDTCFDEEGEVLDCREHLAVNVQKNQVLAEALSVGEGRPLKISFWYRNQGVDSAFLDLRMCLNACDNPGDGDLRLVGGELPALDLGDDHLVWTQAEFTVWATLEQADEIQSFKLWFDGRLHKLIRGFVDLDDVRVEDVNSGALLTNDSAWSFDAETRNSNTAGGFASDAIDRMGGIAVWGSSSHHLTGGWAWKELWNVAGALFQGRTLGESLVMESAMSGIIYGDPLYRPYGVSIANSMDVNMVPPFGKLVLTLAEAQGVSIELSALHGMGHTQTLRWALSRCAYEDPAHCNEEDWAELKNGVGAIRAHSITLAQLGALEENTGWTLRLRAWQHAHPENHISAFGRYEIYKAD